MPRDRAYEEMRPSGTGYDHVDPRHHYVRMDELEAQPRKPSSKKKKKRPKPKRRSPDRSTQSDFRSTDETTDVTNVRTSETFAPTENTGCGGARKHGDGYQSQGDVHAIDMPPIPDIPMQGSGSSSKLDFLMIIMAVIFVQFILVVAAIVIVILHHARIVDWFPALIHMTGEGYLREISANETIDDLLSIP